jgi:TetR/AcrR family transcriptional regulator, tetracycline repressor protein
MARPTKTVNSDDSGIPWWPAGSAGRGNLSREIIATAAADILESGGRSALTLRAVAQAVGAGTMSLYWYIDGKDDLVDLAVDQIMSAVEVPRRGDWRARVRRLARSFYGVLVDHPAVLPLLAEGVTVGPNLLRVHEALLDALLEAGLSPRDTAHAATAIAGVVTNIGVAATPGPDRWTSGKAMTDLSPAHFPRTVALAAELTGADAEEQFLYGLDLLLDGIAMRCTP